MPALRQFFVLIVCSAVLSVQVPSFVPEAHATPVAAWPVSGHDSQRTNRSPLTGPLHLRLLQTRSDVYPNPVIGSDGSIYGWTTHGITRLDPSLKTVWTYPAYENDGGPLALAPDGSIRVVGSVTKVTSVPDSAVFALSSTGTLLWKVQPAAFLKGLAPLVTDSGRFYVPYVGPTSDHSGLDVVSPEGQVLQHILPGIAIFAIAEGRDGTIYVLHQDTESWTYDALIGLSAFSPTGERVWKRRVGPGQFSMGLLVGQDGSVYASVPGRLVKFSSNGRRQWKRSVDNAPDVLAERADGTILVANELGLVAFTPHGRRLWYTRFHRPPAVTAPTTSLMVDAMGTAYVLSRDGTLRVTSSSGQVIQTVRIGPPMQYGSVSSLALDSGGRLIADWNGSGLRVYGP